MMLPDQDFETALAEMSARLVKMEKRLDRMNVVAPTFILIAVSALCFGLGVSFARGEPLWTFAPGFIGTGAGSVMMQYSTFRYVKHLRERTKFKVK